MPPVLYKGVHMPKFEDLTGQRFGRLTVLRRGENHTALSGRQYTKWSCLCDCGNVISTCATSLKTRRAKSCGCLNRENYEKQFKEFMDANYIEGTSIDKIDPSKPLRKNNKSGINGVFWDEKRQKWQARIMLCGKSHNLGRFFKLEDAIKARKLAEELYFEPILERYKKETEA